MSEGGQKRLQELAAEASKIIDQMFEVAKENSIPWVQFLSGVIQFGIADWHYLEESKSFEMDPDSFEPAAKGPIIHEYAWNASTLDCWPTEDQRRWMYGDDPTKWKRTSYEDDY